MITLAFDTSTPWFTLALGNRSQIFFQKHCFVGKDHSLVLIQTLEEMKKMSLFKTASPERIVIGLGPGSFTGIKIANMTARALAYSLKCPLTGFSTLEMVAFQVRKQAVEQKKSLLIPVLFHKKNEIFWSEFHLKNQYQYSSTPKIQVGAPENFIHRYPTKEMVIVTPWIELYHYFQNHAYSCFPIEYAQPRSTNLIEMIELQNSDSPSSIFTLAAENALPLYGSRIFENE